MTVPSVNSVPPSSVSEHEKNFSEYALPGGEIQHLSLSNAQDAIIARATVRDLAASLGYNLFDQIRISTAIYEIARDIVVYAGQGEIVITWAEDTLQRKGLRFLCHDSGLSDPRLTAMFQTGGHETHNKLNFMGLQKLVDEFSFAKDPGYGNCVTVIKWIEP